MKTETNRQYWKRLLGQISGKDRTKSRQRKKKVKDRK